MSRILFLLVFACSAQSWEPVGTLLRTKCGACHGDRVKTSGFSVSTMESVIAGGSKYGTSVNGGNPDQSVLIRMLKGELAPRMPMGGALTDGEISTITAWVHSLPPTKAAGPSRWAFEKPVRPAIPAGRYSNPIDAFVAARRGDRKPAPQADKRTVARRVYFDLVGMPPTIDELHTFLEDQSADAYDKLIDRLLADKRYGERWGRHWLDLARYGETSGLEGDGAIGNVWRYRDWVIDAFNDNMPYDRFVIQQLAGGDEHSKTRNNYEPDVQGFIPTAFLRVAPWDRSNLVAAEVRQNYLAEVTAATSSIFLGLTVGCARCHDHKYDPIPQKDFYRMQAFFNAVQAGGSVNVPYKDPAMKARAESEIVSLEQRLHDGQEKRDFDALQNELLKKLIAAKQAAAQGRKLTANDLRLEMKIKDERVFSAAEKARYLELLEDANRTQDPDEKSALDVVEKPFLERLEKAYSSVDGGKRFEALTEKDVESEATAKYSGKSIFSLDEKNRYAELSGKLDVLRRRIDRWKPQVLAVTNVAGPPTGPDIAPTRVLIRGNYNQPGEAVEAAFPSCLTKQAVVWETDRYRQFPTRGRRLTLAKWIASPDNPLTARVMVNRIWQHHFGEGIVRTTSDFGKNGDKPVHPELLDWLGLKFVESGWDIKAMHKLMLTSDTYKQSAENPGANDPENRFLTRFERRRLEAEAIRDSILMLSGRLNREMGGPSVFPDLPADLADFARYGRTGGAMWESNAREEDARRRSVYIFQRRSLPLPMMAAFDANVFSESCERRSATTTPLQALSLMNGDLIHEESVHLAKLLKGSDRKAQIEDAFERILSRRPTTAELTRFTAYEGTMESICRVLLNSNEFLYVE